MSFSKSKSKRFNEILSCAPPVGKYDLAIQQKAAAASFEKSDRFKVPKEPQNGNSTLHSSLSMDSLLFEKTPIKKLFDTESKNSMKGGKSFTPCHPDLNRQILDLQKEIRHLLQQRTEQDKLLNSKQAEVTKLDGRLQATLKDKSALEAGLATAEKQLSSMRKAKEVLMNKVDTVESNVHKKQEEMQKQLHETTNKLKHKDKEISRLKDELTGQVRHLQADLKEAYSKVQALQETKDIQEQLTIDAQKHTETIETQATQLQVLSVENSDLKSVITEVKEDLKNAKEFLKTLSQENEQEASKLRMESEKTISNLQQQLTTAESEIKTLNENITSSEKRLENEVLRAEEAVTRADDAVKEADNAVNQVATLTEKLEMTENMMNENLKALSTKYQLLEEDYTACQQDRQQETEQLRFELDAVYSTSSEIEAERDSLLEGNRQLMDSVEKEREVGIRLQEQLMAAEQRIETTKEQHEEYKEQMENDLLVLSEAKNSLLILSCELKEKVKSLEEENQLLHKDLSR
ncbi:early endosome antigen 1-like [Anneissia japonica]|uniref:early endosome antigen 1-like n=1 Tax=Anneissia japonica TaxID=1529436 RepID=UPI0014259A87|nr:early endosome antigen 1-like [Anneissia japonica]